MTEEIRILKEIVDNNDLDNYTIDDNECYLNGYARKCLKKVLDYITKLQTDNKRLQHNEKVFKDRNEKAIEYLGINEEIHDWLVDENMKKDKEIERLNNIINELEKWLNKENGTTIFDYQNAIEDVLNKLQGLKGDSSMTAKEMFEKLGYEIDEQNDNEILYKMKWEITTTYWVGFYIECKDISIFETSDSPFEPSKPFNIDMDLLQAINKQVEELGW